jgi:DNA-binding SARP family transcriptional activator
VEFAILGQLEIEVDHERVTLPTGRGQRALFLCLLLHRNEVVSVDAMIEAIWPGDPPATAAKIVQVYVSQWRKIVGDRLATRAPGYVLTVHDGELDADEAQALAVKARGVAPAEAAMLLKEALSLWRGEPLVDVRYASFAQPDAARLDELRVSLAERRADAELELGRHAELVGELEALVAAHPLHERFRAQLMLALYRSGRQADALAVYRDARRVLVSDLGLEPGDELQSLQRSILEHHESVRPPPAAPARLGRRRPARRRDRRCGGGAVVGQQRGRGRARELRRGDQPFVERRCCGCSGWRPSGGPRIRLRKPLGCER